MVNDSGATVVVVGSLHYDIMVDAPFRPRTGETVAGTAWRPKFGGKGGNQAVAAARAGARVRMSGAVGGDEFGVFLLRRLAEAGVDATYIAREPALNSGMSVAVTDAGGDYAAVIVSGANLAIDPAGLSDPDLWQDAAVLVLQNEVPEAVNLTAAQEAKARGLLVCLNAAPFRSLSAPLAACVDVLIVNGIEAEQLCGTTVADLESAAVAAERLAQDFPTAVVTAGGDGVASCLRRQAPCRLPAVSVTLVSTHGAGDVFVGCLAAALASARELSEGLRLANEAAARHVSNPV